MDTPFHWLEFNLFVLVALAFDLGVFHRKAHKISLREAAAWSLVWITLAVLFGLGVLHWYGKQPSLEYFTGYLIEKALSLDNLFVFLLIFRAFQVDEKYQHRVLAWGILGALLMRGIMIAAGAVLIQRFAWVLDIFGLFLLYAGAHMLFAQRSEMHPEKNPLFRFASRHLRVTSGYRDKHFFVREGGAWLATPLFLVLLVLEITDVAFAVDSIPAIFGITRDPFIVYTSNVFAILGLRSLYFLLAGVIDRFRYLTTGLSFVLMFIGAKMVTERWIHVSTGVSLGVVLGILAITFVASLLSKPASPEEQEKAAS